MEPGHCFARKLTAAGMDGRLRLTAHPAPLVYVSYVHVCGSATCVKFTRARDRKVVSKRPRAK